MVLTIPFRACSCGYPAQLIGDFTNDAVDTFNIQNCSLLEGLAGCGNNITASDVGTSAIVNAILGLLSFLGFGILRSRIKIYRARLACPATTVKPPRLPEGGLSQIFSWIPPVLLMSDQSLLECSGLDALMYTRFLMLSVQFFVPISVVSLGVLLPVHYTAEGDGYNRCEYPNPKQNADRLFRTTVSNMCPNEPLLWVHFVFVYLVLAWAMWLLQKHYVAYSSLRHHYIGIPQKPNRWFERYIDVKVGGKEEKDGMGDRKDEFCNTPTLAYVNEEFVSPRPPVDFESVEGTSESPPTKDSPQRSDSLRNIASSVAGWKDFAKAWFSPDKLLDHKGEEPEDIKVFNSIRRADDSNVMSKYNGENDAVSNVILTSMSLKDQADVCTPSPRRGDHLDSTESLERGTSFAALKWWDVYTETSASGSKKGHERECMVRPSVRHIKGVNCTQDDLLVSVNAAQYAVLVTDIPQDTVQVETLRRNHSRTHSRETNRLSFGTEDDFDALQDIDPSEDICTQVFKQIFPESFMHVVPVHDFSSVTKLLLQWDKAAQRLEIQEGLYQKTGVRPTMRTGFLGLCGTRVDSIEHLQKVVEKLNLKIKRERRRAKLRSERKCSFVLFNNQVDAAVAAQSVLLPLDGTKFVTHRAPGPDNINWLTLFKSNKDKFVRRLLILPILIIVMVFPAGFFSSAMAVLDSLFCTDTAPVYWDWYCSTTSPIGILLKRLITGWLPSLLVTVWQNVIVTRVFYIAALVECVAFSLSGVDKRITSLYFYWDFFNIFLGSVLGAGLFTLFGQAIGLDDLRDVLEAIGQGITSSATFLTNYVLLRAFCLVPFKLLFPHPGILGYLLSFVRGRVTRRQRFDSWSPKSWMYGRESGTSLLMCLIGVVYSATSPITVGVVAVYFLGMVVVARHHLIYVYSRNYESGGELWPVLFDRLIIILGSFAIFTSCQLLTKQAWFQAVTIFLTAPFLLFKFWSIQRKRHALVSEHIPLDIAWRQPKASVPPQMYIASELRSGAVGWHPEQGKAWSGYGLPRFL